MSPISNPGRSRPRDTLTTDRIRTVVRDAPLASLLGAASTTSPVPFSISIDADRGIARVSFDGVVTGSEILRATDELIASPEYESEFDQLWVLTDVTTLSFDLQEMKALVEHDRQLIESGAMGYVRVGIVVSGEVRAVVIRLYEYHMSTSGQSIRLFTRRDAAEAWLQEA